MDLLANDLSVHGQFHSLAEFRDALTRFMALRMTARRFRRAVHCGGTFRESSPMPGVPMKQAIGNLGSANQRRAVMSWLNQSGPFWDEARHHGKGDWLESGGQIVTDTAVGEAAFRAMHDVECGLVSFSPSNWCRSPVDVTWVRKGEELPDRSVEIGNWWSAGTLDDALQRFDPPTRSWDDLRKKAAMRFDGLVFAEGCFAPLAGIPFAKSAADRFMALLSILDRLVHEVDEDGSRNAEGHRLYQDYFTGDRALFSDSSDSEKRKFRKELTFAHPTEQGSALFCPWHGKISFSTLRLHFSWPIKAGEPAYVVYAGPKITKR